MEKVSFVIYYDEERSLEECIYYIRKLQLPKDFEMEILHLKNAKNFRELRECANQASKSKYKIFLDQNTLITNNFFLYEILSRFQHNPKIGAIGVWGDEEEPLGRMLLWSEEGITEAKYVSERADKEAKHLGEMLIATQYDEDICDCISVIPYQDSSWCVYDCRSDKGEGLEREYRYQLLRAENFHDVDSREMVGKLLDDNRLTLGQHVNRAENQAYAKTIMGYYWEDFYYSARKWKKYLPANGRISLDKDANESMNIVMSFNHGYVKYAQIMLQSLYVNNGLVNIHVHVLQCDLRDEDKELLQKQAKEFKSNISFYRFDTGLLPKEIITTAEWSIEAYFRLFMVDILPQNVDRILYLDVDVIVNKPLYDFYYMDMQQYEIVGCRDFSLILKEGFADRRKELLASVWNDERFVYINSGVMLVDIGCLRTKREKLSYMQVLIEQKDKIVAPDQDIINLVHWENIGLVDEYRYDFFNACLKGLKSEEVKQYVSLIHYAGPKPWAPIDTNLHAHKIWWEYARLIKES